MKEMCGAWSVGTMQIRHFAQESILCFRPGYRICDAVQGFQEDDALHSSPRGREPALPAKLTVNHKNGNKLVIN